MLRYLWIDSLCIIQNSNEDWARELKRMGTIYRDSFLTTSVMASSGSNHGIIPCHDQPQYAPRPVVCFPLRQHGETILLTREDFDEENLNRLDSAGPLSSRGWCLQKSVLSPRQLYYGQDQIYWRCPAGYEAADGTSVGLRIPETSLPSLTACV